MTDLLLRWLPLYLHLLTALLWVGGGVAMAFVVRPALGALPPAERREALARIGPARHRFFTWTRVPALAFGALSAATFGRSGELLTLDTRWGQALVLSAVLGLVLLWQGNHVSGTIEARLGPGKPVDPAVLRSLERHGRLQAAGFVAALVLMALVRFS